VAADFLRISWLTGVAVLLVMALRFRHPRQVGLVLLPALLGALWTASLYTLLDLRLNLMNLGVLPMVLALGIDDGIHILHRHQRGGEAAAQRPVYVGVMLTSLTTMITFGSLAVSSNQGIASVGILSFVGVGSCLVASVLVLPAALALTGSRTPAPISPQEGPAAAADDPPATPSGTA
jgi:uncharacterized protein